MQHEEETIETTAIVRMYADYAYPDHKYFADKCVYDLVSEDVNRIDTNGKITLTSDVCYPRKGKIKVTGSIKHYEKIYDLVECVVAPEYRTIFLPFGDFYRVIDGYTVIRRATEYDLQYLKHGHEIQMAIYHIDDKLIETQTLNNDDLMYTRPNEMYGLGTFLPLMFMHSIELIKPVHGLQQLPHVPAPETPIVKLMINDMIIEPYLHFSKEYTTSDFCDNDVLSYVIEQSKIQNTLPMQRFCIISLIPTDKYEADIIVKVKNKNIVMIDSEMNNIGYMYST